MFFSLSKLFWFFFAPSHLIFWLLLAGGGALLLKRERIGRWLAISAAGLFLIFGILPFNTWLMRSIENRYPRPAWPAHVDGILVLGGGLDENVLRARGVVGFNFSEARLVSAYEVARKYPNARVIFTGGSGRGGQDSESVVAKHIFGQMGLAPNRLALEGRSRNTWENFVYAKALARPRPSDVWILATSAYHMPRAMEIAKRVGWKMVPWPSDYLTLPKGGHNYWGFTGNLDRSDIAVHEWIGLLTYRLSGKAAH